MKDFDFWNENKKEIERALPLELKFREREVWYCSIGLNVGDEQDGKNDLFERPVLVIKKFNAGLAWVLPIASKRVDSEYYHHVPSNMGGFTVVLSQLRIISVKRFNRRIFKIHEKPFAAVIQRLVRIIQG